MNLVEIRIVIFDMNFSTQAEKYWMEVIDEQTKRVWLLMEEMNTNGYQLTDISYFIEDDHTHNYTMYYISYTVRVSVNNSKGNSPQVHKVRYY